MSSFVQWRAMAVYFVLPFSSSKWISPTKKGFADGFIVDFADSFARDAYLEDSEHKQTGGRLVAAAEGGIAGILVYDLETDD